MWIHIATHFRARTPAITHRHWHGRSIAMTVRQHKMTPKQITFNWALSYYYKSIIQAKCEFRWCGHIFAHGVPWIGISQIVNLNSQMHSRWKASKISKRRPLLSLKRRGISLGATTRHQRSGERGNLMDWNGRIKSWCALGRKCSREWLLMVHWIRVVDNIPWAYVRRLLCNYSVDVDHSNPDNCSAQP
jgi:hypothetical protein